jgi:transaldolase/glucose-6-phosphate isomerase
MAKNPLFELQEAGTSVWLDYIRRSLMTSGELERMIEEDAVVGMTSNPTIFEKAIGGSSDYDDAITRQVAAGKSGEELFLTLMVEDIQMAADVLKPVYDQTGQKDGYVSIEVLPRVAHDTQGTIKMAHQLYDRVGRPNILVKIPATPEGLPAIERCIADGININITLMFSVNVYEQVARAYIRGLQQRMREGKPVQIASVASFFVSRVDTAVDKLLEAKIQAATDPAERSRLQSLLGKAAIANAKLAYKKFREIFTEAEFKELAPKGARVQRPLWASTGTKNPHYSDVLYVEELIGPDTVNTMPQQTMMAFKEHGEVRLSLLENVAGAEEVMRQLANAGIDMEQVTQDLLVDGVKLFDDSVNKLLEELEKKTASLRAQTDRPGAQLGAIGETVRSRLKQLDSDAVVRRIYEKDAGLWVADPAAQKEIKERLGWLQVVDQMDERVPELEALRKDLLKEGFTDAVLVGMGGSSLAPEVFRLTFGTMNDALRLHVLDTTDPAAIAALDHSVKLEKAVFVVSSKSGTTLETLSHYHYFWEQTGGNGRQFLAITDPGTPLAQEATARKFRRVFLNPSDIGGRYSALSYFGLVPAALAGIDVVTLLDRAQGMVQACSPAVPAAENEGAWLGTVLAESALAGRDKVTIIAPEPIASFGLWVEQLLAESTGKEGKGLVPVADEPLGSPDVYGDDRLFVYLDVWDRKVEAIEDPLLSLAADGQPVVRLRVGQPIDIGAEFYRWELAVAVAGAILKINVFDQPNVQEAKDLTKKVLSEGIPPTRGDGIRWTGQPGSTMEAAVASLLGQVRPHDYVALMAFIPPDPDYDRALTAIRVAIRDKHLVATTVGYGPRFLHSTGQLHKGGPNTGVFLQIVGDDPRDLPIPGAAYTFGALKQAQALGDYMALVNHGRRVLRIQLDDVTRGLSRIAQAVGASIQVG